MSTKQGAALQNYNNELVKCLEELSHRRQKLQKQIQDEESVKRQLESQMVKLRQELDSVETSLRGKHDTLAKYNATIAESEQAYLKILESSQVLLNVLKRDAQTLDRSDDAQG